MDSHQSSGGIPKEDPRCPGKEKILAKILQGTEYLTKDSLDISEKSLRYPEEVPKFLDKGMYPGKSCETSRQRFQGILAKFLSYPSKGSEVSRQRVPSYLGKDSEVSRQRFQRIWQMLLQFPKLVSHSNVQSLLSLNCS
jgi:hypothetical protein